MTEHPRLRSLWEMLRFDASQLLSALTRLEAVIHVAKQDPAWLDSPTSIEYAQSDIEALVKQLRALYVPTTLKAAERLAYVLKPARASSPALAGYLERRLEDVKSRLEDELNGRFLLSLEAERAGVFDKGASCFGPEVMDAFPEALTDLDEAAKCHGLTRNTATVFHLMRAMEFALHKLGEKLKARVLAENGSPLMWGIVIGNMSPKVAALPDGPEKEAFSDALLLLRNVKDAWRNPTMHPKQSYSDDETSEIFQAVRRFMRALSGLV